MTATEIILPDDQQISTDSPTLWGTSDPAKVIERATAVSNALGKVVREQHLSVRIGAKDHLMIEAWQLCGSMVGVFAVCTWTKSIERDGKLIAWEAHAEAVTRAGAVVGGAEAMCSRDEATWKHRDEYALRSMAQTRAMSKALAAPLRFIAVLAGFAGTPAEEMPRDGAEKAPRGQSTARWVNHPTTGKGSACKLCAAEGLTSTTGAPATFRLSKRGDWQCNGRTNEIVKDGERGWMNHPMPLIAGEEIESDAPIPFA